MKNNGLNKEVGVYLRRRRDTEGIRQEDVAKYIGVSRTQVVNMEQGTCSLTLPILYRLCEMYDCQPADILPPAYNTIIPEEMETALKLMPEDKRSEARRELKRLLTN